MKIYSSPAILSNGSKEESCAVLFLVDITNFVFLFSPSVTAESSSAFVLKDSAIGCYVPALAPAFLQSRYPDDPPCPNLRMHSLRGRERPNFNCQCWRRVQCAQVNVVLQHNIVKGFWGASSQEKCNEHLGKHTNRETSYVSNLQAKTVHQSIHALNSSVRETRTTIFKE